MNKKQRKIIKYSEADLIKTFGLTRLKGNDGTMLIKEWFEIAMPIFDEFEQILFETTYQNAYKNIEGWNEEELKMKFIAFIINLGQLTDGENYKTYFEREIYTTVDSHYLYLKADFMIAKGILDSPDIPYFYFQEYKKMKDPSGDPVPQLIEGFLIAQALNNNDKPLYGCTVTGKYWDFFVMQNKTYCISKSYDCTERADLLTIIAILRKFKYILETKLLF